LDAPLDLDAREPAPRSPPLLHATDWVETKDANQSFPKKPELQKMLKKTNSKCKMNAALQLGRETDIIQFQIFTSIFFSGDYIVIHNNCLLFKKSNIF